MTCSIDDETSSSLLISVIKGEAGSAFLYDAHLISGVFSQAAHLSG
jgi:hypothetical protein